MRAIICLFLLHAVCASAFLFSRVFFFIAAAAAAVFVVVVVFLFVVLLLDHTQMFVIYFKVNRDASWGSNFFIVSPLPLPSVSLVHDDGKMSQKAFRAKVRLCFTLLINTIKYTKELNGAQMWAMCTMRILYIWRICRHFPCFLSLSHAHMCTPHKHTHRLRADRILA